MRHLDLSSQIKLTENVIHREVMIHRFGLGHLKGAQVQESEEESVETH